MMHGPIDPRGNARLQAFLILLANRTAYQTAMIIAGLQTDTGPRQ